jgi:hypothetical protein
MIIAMRPSLSSTMLFSAQPWHRRIRYGSGQNGIDFREVATLRHWQSKPEPETCKDAAVNHLPTVVARFPALRFRGDLRPSQHEVVEIARQKLAAGARRLHIVAPPGSGKTVLGLYLWAACFGGRRSCSRRTRPFRLSGRRGPICSTVLTTSKKQRGRSDEFFFVQSGGGPPYVYALP